MTVLLDVRQSETRQYDPGITAKWLKMADQGKSFEWEDIFLTEREQAISPPLPGLTQLGENNTSGVDLLPIMALEHSGDRLECKKYKKGETGEEINISETQGRSKAILTPIAGRAGAIGVKGSPIENNSS